MCRRICRKLLLLAVSLTALPLFILEARFQFVTRVFSDLPASNNTWVQRTHRSPNSRSPPMVLFAVETISLAETSRMMLLARHLRSKYSRSELRMGIFHYGAAGSFNYSSFLQDSEGTFAEDEVFLLEPQWASAEAIEQFYRIDRMEDIGDVFEPAALRTRVSSELALYEKLKPDVLVTGFVLSLRLSAAIAGIPTMIAMPTILPNYNYLVESVLDSAATLLRSWWPEAARAVERWKKSAPQYFPKALVSHSLVWLYKRIWYLAAPFREVAAQDYGIRPAHESVMDLLLGDTVLVTDVPSMAGISQTDLSRYLGESFKYVGLMFARLPGEPPDEVLQRIEEVKRRQSGEPNMVLYFAMGSSGKQDIVRNVLESLDRHFKVGDVPLLSERIGLVISPTLRLLNKFGDEEHRGFLENLDHRLMVTDILPSVPQINRLCDVAILHGGQGTVHTAVSEGLPFVGVPAQIEQESNIKTIVHASRMLRSDGSSVAGAVYVPKAAAEADGDAAVVEGLVEGLLRDYNGTLAQMRKLQGEVGQYESVTVVEQLLREHLGWGGLEVCGRETCGAGSGGGGGG